MFLEAPCYFFPCPFFLRSSGILENRESVVPVESNVVSSIFVCNTYICMYVCVHIYMYMYMYMCIYIYVCVCVYVYIYVCVCVLWSIGISLCIYMYIDT